ncbi:hypothetical protein WOLCODRAFT_29523 [Wolfiporia cocos MD-104 SS10]|uniref:DUF6533 domain-containing protein n=1 Tax=Wolfiporia cocos (strain MD-104) TaxID=742152 RepID=A0A2H3JRV4_WOLCO|nr:hypothetical protein WOLCODRAFT_29523 [Wolfiporia cocos MD-104 SS10]
MTYSMKLYFVSTCGLCYKNLIRYRDTIHSQREALIIYDGILTFSDEARLMWSRQLTAVALCLFNRIAVLGWTATIFIWTLPIWKTQESCEIQQTSAFIFTLMLTSAWAVLSALRVYAVSRSNSLLTALTFCFGMAPVVVYTVTENIKLHDVLIPYVDLCGQSNFQGRTLIVLAVRLSAIISDAIVLFVTWFYARDFRFLNRLHWGSFNLPLASFTMIRDGMHIIDEIMFSANLVSMIITWYKAGIMDQSPSSDQLILFLATFLNSLTGIMVSRFILNIRQAFEVNRGSWSMDGSLAIHGQNMLHPDALINSAARD